MEMLDVGFDLLIAGLFFLGMLVIFNWLER